jgi:hypothetical protein
MNVDMVSIGLLVGFLVVGTVGIFVGDQMLTTVNQTSFDTFDKATIINTLQIGTALCKIIVLVSVFSIVLTVFRSVLDLVDRDITYPESGPVPRMRVIETPLPQQVMNTPAPHDTYTNPFDTGSEQLPENPYHNRFEAILDDESELESKGK